MPTRHNMIDRGGISRPAASLPLACGIGLKPQHASQLVQQGVDLITVGAQFANLAGQLSLQMVVCTFVAS